MATDNQGIMSLPQGGEPPAPQMGLDDSYDAVMGGLQDASPQAGADLQALMAQITPQLDQLTDEELDSFLQTIQYLYDGGEAEYAKRLKEVLDIGLLDAGDLPEEYDPEVLSAIGAVLLQARRERQGSMQAQMPEPPAGMARGGIANAARMMASRGRSGDTMLAHINKDEAKMLKKRGGMGTINPATGLPEYGFLSKAWKAVTGAVKSVAKAVVNVVKPIVSSPLGKILATVALATFLGPGAMGIGGFNLGAAALPLASGAVTALGGGNIKDVLRSAATAYLAAPGGPVSTYVGNAGAAMGVTNAAAQSAINAGIVGTGVGLLTGQKLQDAVKSGLVAGAIQGGITGTTQGFGAQAGTPLAKAPVPGEYSETLAYAPARDVPYTKYELQNMAYDPELGYSRPITRAEMAGPDINPNLRQNPLTGEFTSVAPAGQTVAGQTPAGRTPAGSATTTGGIAKVPAPGFTESLGRTWDAVKAGDMAGIGSGLKDVFLPEGEASVIRRYGPGVAAGLAVTGAMGGFKPSEPPPSALAAQLKGTPGSDLVNKNPQDYLVQNLPGVQYGPSGNIIGSTPWQPTATMGDVQVASRNYLQPQGGLGSLTGPMYRAPVEPFGSLTGPMYRTPVGALGMSPMVSQPYNTASMYTNLMPRYAAMGGMMEPMTPVMMDGGIASLAQGGYPRRTGQISGPGTETSDSIPAMLSDGEFVMTAKAVRGAGKGDRRAGAKKMYALMHQLERNASRG